MLEQVKFNSVIRYGHRDTQGVLNEGDMIAIWEKLDGANASFRRDGDNVAAFSRNQQLDEHNTLRGFYNFVQDNIVADYLPEHVIFFGEWLVPHKVDYGINKNQFYLYAVYDTHSKTYASPHVVYMYANIYELNVSPLLYFGKYQSYEHLKQFVGKSALAEHGEGIVIVNYRYRDKFGNQLMMKMVDDAFIEMQPQKPPRDPNAPQAPESIFIKTYLVKPRVEKLLLKLVDEGVLREDFDISDMHTILKNLGSLVYDDILKEEIANIPDGYEEPVARKTVGKILPLFVKEILKERGGM